MLIHLLEANYVDFITHDVKTMFVGTDGFTTSPTATNPNCFYEPDIAEPMTYNRSMLSDGFSGGIGDGGYGICKILNVGGKYDAYRKHAFDGQTLRWLVGDSNDAYDDFTVVLTGTMVRPEVTSQYLIIKIRDKTELLSKAQLQQTLFLGNNSLPAGIEGVSGDLKDKPRPLCFGRVYYIEPPLVNTSKFVYRVHDGPIYAIDGVFSNGAALTFYQDFATSALLLAATIPAGNYGTCLAEGLFRLNNSGATVITANVRGCALASDGGYVSKPSQIIKRMAKRHDTLADADIDSTSFTAAASAITYETGWYVDTSETPTMREAINDFSEGLGIITGFSRSGLLRIGRFAGITGSETVVADLGVFEIEPGSFDMLPGFTFGDGDPPKKIKLSYQRNYRVLSKTEQAGIISTDPALAAVLQQEWRDVTATAASIHALAGTFEYTTPITNSTDAEVEASRVLALYSGVVDRIRFNVRNHIAQAIDVCDYVRVTLPRFEMESGRIFMVVAVSDDNTSGVTTLEAIG